MADDPRPTIDKEELGLIIVPWLLLQKRIISRIKEGIGDQSPKNNIVGLLLASYAGTRMLLKKRASGRLLLSMTGAEQPPSPALINAIQQAALKFEDGAVSALHGQEIILDTILKEFDFDPSESESDKNSEADAKST